ncbi:hypothetical protein Trco_001184 [Trichoderma cornu-damae]|uniref:Uncharacterized protein n=1 Tax=Trichoderma cornu-damae TaxID=654480 RepID=A0A9P8TZQ3_9HYPO|nr:hypothetical protein Trco_001184 [Trichoderma cornu-damae]
MSVWQCPFTMYGVSQRWPQLGLATLRGSPTPVSGSLNSFQLTGTMSFPTSLVAIMTPSSLDAVER